MNTQQPNNPNPPNSNAPDPLAVALAKLDPVPHGFEWNSLMFAAGRASKTRALIFWRVMTGICALAACGFALAFFTRPEVIVERERVTYRDREVPLPTPPILQPAPNLLPETKPELPPLPPVLPPVPSPMPVPAEPASWSFEQPPEEGVALRWLNKRNEVLTVGLSVLPDPGRKVSPPRTDK